LVKLVGFITVTVVVVVLGFCESVAASCSFSSLAVGRLTEERVGVVVVDAVDEEEDVDLYRSTSTEDEASFQDWRRACRCKSNTLVKTMTKTLYQYQI